MKSHLVADRNTGTNVDVRREWIIAHKNMKFLLHHITKGFVMVENIGIVSDEYDR